MQPGANVACIAHEHGINDNLLFNWRHLWKQGKLAGPQQAEASLLPVSIVPPLPQTTPEATPPADGRLCCEMVLPVGTIRLQGTVTPALLLTLIGALKGETR